MCFQNDSVIEMFGNTRQKQNMLRRKKHGINKEMIHDALDAAGVESMPVAEEPVKVEGKYYRSYVFITYL